MKKIIIIMLALLLIMPTGIKAETSFNEDAATLLDLLEIMPLPSKGSLNAEESVSRGEFASYVANILKLGNGHQETRLYFRDVSNDNPHSEAINTLYERGIISRNQEELFYPDREITLNEASVLLVNILGYRPYAQGQGGYPMGYLQAAMAAGIVKSNAKATVTRADVIQLIYNTVTANIYTGVSYQGNSITYQVSDGKTLLEQYRSVFLTKGIVNGVRGVSLDGENPLRDHQIRIGSDVFNVSEGNEKHLGSYVKAFYYRDNPGDTGRILYIINESTTNDLVIKGEDFISFEDFRLSYYRNSQKSQSSIMLNRGITVVYNGSVMERDISKLFDDFYKGSITLKDSNRDGTYDTLIAVAYENFVVKSFDGLNNLLYGKFQNNIKLDDYDFITVKKEDGTILKDYTFSPLDVLTVAKSNSSIEITINSSTKIGKVEEISLDGVVVDGSVLITDKNYWETVKSQISIGATYLCKLDAYGEIAYMEPRTADSDMSLGYLLRLGVESGIAKVGQIRFFGQDGEVHTLNMAKKVIIDGATEKDPVVVFNKFPGVVYDEKSDSRIELQLFRYKTNQEGEISQIDTYNTTASENPQNSLIKTQSHEEAIYSTNAKQFYKDIVVDDGTIVFNVPSSDVSYDEFSGKENMYFKIGGLSGFQYAEKYDVEAFKLNADEEFATYIVNKSGSSESNVAIVVDRIVDACDSEGEHVKKIYAMRFSTGAREEYLVYDNVKYENATSISDIGSGDALRIVSATRGNETSITEMELVYDYSVGGVPTHWRGYTPERTWYENTWNASDFNFTFGYVTHKGTKVIRYGSSVPGQEDEQINTSLTRVLVYDSSRASEKLYAGSMDDILDYQDAGDNCSRVLIHKIQIMPRGILVYK